MEKKRQIIEFIEFIERLIELHEGRASTLVDAYTVQFLRDLCTDLGSTPVEEFEALRLREPTTFGPH